MKKELSDKKEELIKGIKDEIVLLINTALSTPEGFLNFQRNTRLDQIKLLFGEEVNDLFKELETLAPVTKTPVTRGAIV